MASAAFLLFGMAGSFGGLDKKVLVNRFSLPVVWFVLIATFLTYTLINIAQNHYLNKAIDKMPNPLNGW